MKWGSSYGNQSLVRRGLDWKNSATSPCGLTHMLLSLEHVLGSWSAAPSSSAVWLRHPVPFPLLCTRGCLCVPKCRGKTQSHSLAPSDPSLHDQPLEVQKLTEAIQGWCLWPHGLQHTRLLHPWDFPGKNNGVNCHFHSRGSSPPRDCTHISCIFCIGRQILFYCATGEAWGR